MIHDPHLFCLALARHADNLPKWLPWLADVQAFAPDLFTVCPTCDAPDVPASPDAVSIARSMEGLRDAGSADNWSAIYSTAASHLANADTLARSHGSVDPFRASVDTLCREYDRTPTAVARVVDPIVGQVSEVKRGRNRKGSTAIVRRHGHATVQGRVDPTDPTDRRAAFAAHLIGQMDRRPCGLSALAVAKITQQVYGHDLDPVAYGVTSGGAVRFTTLLGGDTVAWSESGVDPTPIEHETAAPAVQGWTLARSVVDGISTTVMRPTTPGDAVAPVEIPVSGRTLDADGRVVWQAHATCSHTDETRRRNTARRNLARVVARKSETASLATVDGVTPLIASADRPDAIWIGHTLTPRKPRASRKGSHRTRTVARAAKRDAVPVVDIASDAGWLTLVESVERGQAVKVQVNGHVVSIARSALAGKVNARVTLKGRKVLAVQVRSDATAARRLAAAVV